MSREQGMTKRYHAWPTLQQQTVADHTWHVMRIYLEIWGTMSPEVSTLTMLHDAAESETGDVPFGAKRRSPVLRAELHRMERETLTETWGSLYTAAEEAVSPESRLRIKMCDLLEMWDFAQMEIRLGSTMAREIVSSVLRAASDVGQRMSSEDEQHAIDWVRATSRRISAWHPSEIADWTTRSLTRRAL